MQKKVKGHADTVQMHSFVRNSVDTWQCSFLMGVSQLLFSPEFFAAPKQRAAIVSCLSKSTLRAGQKDTKRHLDGDLVCKTRANVGSKCLKVNVFSS